MILRSIVFVSATLLSCSLLAQSGPIKATVAPNTVANAAKLVKPVVPVQPEVMLSVYVFDATNNPNAGVEVTQNGKQWGNCKWGGVNAQPVAGQPSTKLCKFATARGTTINVTQSPGSPPLYALQCNPAGPGACYKTASFALEREGEIEAAFNVKP